MESSTESLRQRSPSKKQVQFKNNINASGTQARTYQTITRRPLQKQVLYGYTPKRVTRRAADMEYPNSAQTKRVRNFDSLSKLRDLAKSIRQATRMYDQPWKQRNPSSQKSESSDKFNRSVELKRQKGSSTNLLNHGASTASPQVMDYQIPRLLESNNKIHALLVHDRGVEMDELRQQIARKQEEVDIFKKKYGNEKKLLVEEIETLGKNNKEYEKCNTQLKVLVKNYQTTIQRLHRELNFYRAQLPRQAVSSLGSKPSEQPRLEKGKEQGCECRKLKKDILRLQHQLRRVQRVSEQYQGVICDLHLTNQMYKQQLDASGQSKKPEFLEAEARLIQAQTNRKKM